MFFRKSNLTIEPPNVEHCFCVNHLHPRRKLFVFPGVCLRVCLSVSNFT